MTVGARAQNPLGLRICRTVVLSVCLVGACLACASAAWAQLPTATLRAPRPRTTSGLTTTPSVASSGRTTPDMTLDEIAKCRKVFSE